MHFRLDDGAPVWAIATATIIVDDEEQTILLFDQEDLEQYPDHTLLDPPSPEILARSKQIEGRTLSKSEFERLLLEPEPDNPLLQQIANLEAENLTLMEAVADLYEMMLGGADQT